MRSKLPLTGMILAGGKSSRMGKDKALLNYGDKTMLEHLSHLLGFLFEETLILVDDKRKLKGLELGEAKAYEDIIKDKGPLGGIYTGLCYAKSQASCVLTCDMPFIDEVLLRELVNFWEEGQEVLCLENTKGEFEPFPGIYARSSRHLMRLLLERGEGAMYRFLELAMVKPLVLRKKRIPILTNMNYVEDYYRVLKEKEERVKE